MGRQRSVPRYFLTVSLAMVALVASAPNSLASQPAFGAGATIVASASGSGSTTGAGELRTFSFIARIDSNGVASGTAQVNNRSVDEKFQLRIDCLKIFGNLAIVSGVFNRHDDAHAVGLTGIFAVVDAGEGSASQADLVTQVFIFEPGVLTCAELGPEDAAPFLVEIDSGNVQVN
jgi:hypothetical protein